MRIRELRIKFTNAECRIGKAFVIRTSCHLILGFVIPEFVIFFTLACLNRIYEKTDFQASGHKNDGIDRWRSCAGYQGFLTDQ